MKKYTSVLITAAVAAVMVVIIVGTITSCTPVKKLFEGLDKAVEKVIP